MKSKATQLFHELAAAHSLLSAHPAALIAAGQCRRGACSPRFFSV
jgi:hypothetical protein